MIVRIWMAMLAAVLMVLAPAAVGQPLPMVTVGYIPAFKGLDRIVAGAELNGYTHVNLAFVNPAGDGSVIAGESLACMSDGDGMVSLAALRAVVARAQAAGAKALVSLGGGVIPACSGDWEVLLAPDRRAETVHNLIALVDAAGLDGIDVDLEGALLTAIDRAGNYTPFVAALGAALRARGKLLTCATASYEGGMIPVSAIPWFDLVNVMSYDAIGPSWGRAGDAHASYAQAVQDLVLWRSLGVPKERLVLGVPFYGYGFGSYRRNYAWREISAEFGIEAATGQDVIGERCPGCDYITFNGLDTLERKARLANDLGAGVMVWEISQDAVGAPALRTLRKALYR